MIDIITYIESLSAFKLEATQKANDPLFPEFTLAEVAQGVERIVKALPDSADAAEVERFSKALYQF